MRKLSTILLVGLFTLGCGLFGSQSYEPSEYISTTGIANPDSETKIELEDGAAIVIPANTIDDEISVKVERNPEKANNLPPLDEGVVKVGDFYNFEIDGTLNGPVDLVLPFDPDSVPENKEGVLVVAVPTENGWKYTPVVPDGNKVTLYTDEVGDPIIAWHFACIDRVDLNYEGQPEDPCEEERAKKLVCDPDISLQVIQNGDQFEVVGSVVPIAKNFFGSTVSEPASNITVNLNLNLREVGSGQKFFIQTDENGSFSYNLDSSQLKEGWNWVFAKAECDPWWGKLVVESNGYAEFKYTPALVQQPASTSVPQSSETPVATAIPAPVETPIPVGAVLLPDFVGQDIDDAIDWLKSNGFKYTWIDGSSTYDLGIVYKQSPFGGQYKIPHRTVVVLHRTVEKVKTNIVPDFYAIYRCTYYLYDGLVYNAFRYDSGTGELLEGIYTEGESESDCGREFQTSLVEINENGAPIFSENYLWLWSDGSSIFIPEYIDIDDDCDIEESNKISAYELVLIGQEVISIMGQDILAQKYEGVFTEEDICTISTDYGFVLSQGATTQWTVNYYFDITSGILLKYVWKGVVTDCFGCNSDVVGKRHEFIYELVDTNQPLE